MEDLRTKIFQTRKENRLVAEAGQLDGQMFHGHGLVIAQIDQPATGGYLVPDFLEPVRVGLFSIGGG
jgi:hypothetical protein